GETMWFKPKEILQYQFYEGALPGLVPFATETCSDLWCWYPEQSGPLGAPVLQCIHDDPQARFYAPNVMGWVYRRLLDHAWLMANSFEDEKAEGRELLRSWLKRVRSVFPPEWSETLDGICQSPQLLSGEQRETIVSRDLAFPLLGHKVRWKP
ncbi:hypothetical protein ACFL09_03985, partial [Planctomycetota bacterium]